MTRRLELSLPVTTAAVGELMERLEGFAEEAELPPRLGSHLLLACEELAANVVEHSGGATAIWIEIREEGVGLRVDFADDGPAFDPLSVAEPDLATPAEERLPGGLGLYLVRKLSAEIVYGRRDGRNRISLRLGEAGRDA